MPICKKCGQSIQPGARVCIYCGAEVVNPVSPVCFTKPRRNWTMIALFCCAGALALLIVVLLLAALLFEKAGENAYRDITKPQRAMLATIAPETTAPSVPEMRIPCTGIELLDSELTLGGQVMSMQLSYSLEPIDTTDLVEFRSGNTAVAVVDHHGRVTAVGDGITTITITCGDFTKTCKVVCVLDTGDEPQDPVVPDEPMPTLQLRMTDVSINAKGYQWRAYKQTADFGAEEAAKFTWKVDDESVVRVDNGIVTTLAPGRTELRVYYGDELVATCVIRCIWKEEVSEDADKPETPDVPAEPAQTYLIKINHAKPAYHYNNQPNSAEITLAIGQKFKLTLVEEELEQIMTDVQWVLSDDTVCAFDGMYVTGLKKGTCKITAEYKGVTYLVFVRVTG